MTRRSDLSQNSNVNIIFSDKTSTLAAYLVIVCMSALLQQLISEPRNLSESCRVNPATSGGR